MAKKLLVGFFTDVEGNLRHFERYLDISKVLRRRSGASVSEGLRWQGNEWEDELELQGENTVFVFGGDVCDRGEGDIRIAKRLTSLKRRFPHRVYLLLGNRDLNKLRFAAELAEPEMQKVHLSNLPHPFWVTEPSFVPYPSFLQARNLPAPSALSRLQWMLTQTMGCPDTFEMRRRELHALSSSSSSGPEGGDQPRSETLPSDAEVVASFVDSVATEGPAFMREFIEEGQLGLVLGDTMFVHGAVNETCAGAVPHEEAFVAGTVHPEAKGWIDCLNLWKDRQLARFRSSPLFAYEADPDPDPDHAGLLVHKGDRAYEAIIDYNRAYGKDGAKIPTVVSNWYLVDGHPRQPSSSVQTFLRSSSIRRVVSGHQPWGDSPLLLRTSGGVEIVTADTSYSHNALWTDPDVPKPDPSWKLDTRGTAISEVLIEAEVSPDQGHDLFSAPWTRSAMRMHGLLSNGLPFDFVVEEDDPFLGLTTTTGELVKARLPDGKLVLAKGMKRVVENRIANPQDIQIAPLDPVPSL